MNVEIFHRILSIPQTIVMDLNNVMQLLNFFINSQSISFTKVFDVDLLLIHVDYS